MQFVIGFYFYYRRYILKIVEPSFDTPSSKVFITLKVIQLIIDLIMIAVFVITSKYFIELKMNNLKENNIKLTVYNKIIISWVTIIFLYNVGNCFDKNIMPIFHMVY